MIIRIPFTVIILLFAQNLFSQDLDFHSDLEKVVFNSYLKDSTGVDLFKALNVIDSSTTAQKISSFKNEVDTFIISLPPKEDKEKKEEKRIKKIFDLVHKRFFKQYSIDAYFPDIFDKGVYNCVTATALYGYIFNQIKIPFVVKESPAHVYLIAYPKTQNIHLETTVPGGLAFKEFESSQIKETVNNLIESKLLSQDSVNIKGYEKTFYDYFYNNEDILLNELIGVQYYNKGISHYNTANYDDAENDFRKSLIFYKSEITNYLVKEIIKYNLSKLNFSNIKDIEYLIRAINQMELSEDYSLKQIKGLVYSFLINDDVNQDIILNSVEKFKKINDSIVKSEILESCYVYLAERNTNLGKTDKALKYVEDLAGINPKNKYIKTIVGYNIANKIPLLSLSKSSLDSIQKYVNKYPFLEEDARIVSSKFIILLKNTNDSYRLKNATEGDKFKAKMESYYEEKKDLIRVNPDLVAETYRSIGSYYYGRKKYALAINMYKKGLMFSPEHTELNKLLKWAKEDQ